MSSAAGDDAHRSRSESHGRDRDGQVGFAAPGCKQPVMDGFKPPGDDPHARAR